MNLVPGRMENGVFTAPGIRVEGLAIAGPRDVTLGIRPEDCRVDGSPAHLGGTTYGVEPMGDLTLLSVRTEDGRLFEVKCGRGFRAPLDSTAHVAFDLERIYVFDRTSGRRLRPSDRT
jgi:multiple sugar transport system ATP-binding protein